MAQVQEDRPEAQEPQAKTQTLSVDGWLAKLSRQLDILTLVLLDLRRDINGQQPRMDVPDPDQLPAYQPPEKPPSLGEPRIMVNGKITHVRQPLSGKNFLVGTFHTSTGALASLDLETPDGDRTPVSPDEIEATFGIKIGVPVKTSGQTDHPTDRSLNPDVEVA
jgi:hypothetical protein